MRETADDYLKLGFRNDVLEKIMFANANRLLKLELGRRTCRTLPRTPALAGAAAFVSLRTSRPAHVIALSRKVAAE